MNRMNTTEIAARFADEDLYNFDVTEFWEADLMDANPDIRDQTSIGLAIVLACKFEFEDQEYYFARYENGEDRGNLLADDLREGFIVLAETEAEAREAADEMILDWKRAWNMIA